MADAPGGRNPGALIRRAIGAGNAEAHTRYAFIDKDAPSCLMIPAPLRESTQSLVCRSHRIRRVPIDSDARGMCPALPLAGRPLQTEETTSQRLDLNGNRPPR